MRRTDGWMMQHRWTPHQEGKYYASMYVLKKPDSLSKAYFPPVLALGITLSRSNFIPRLRS